MDAITFNTHKETFKINDVYYTATAHYIQNRLDISFENNRARFTLDEYTNFDGNM